MSEFESSSLTVPLFNRKEGLNILVWGLRETLIYPLSIVTTKTDPGTLVRVDEKFPWCRHTGCRKAHLLASALELILSLGGKRNASHQYFLALASLNLKHGSLVHGG